MRYIKGLDTLRAFAVIFVLVWHFFPRPEPDSTAGVLVQLFLPTGVFGVTLFFVLSGYLISNILLTARHENSNITVIKNFIIRRALRIFPIYYFTLIALCILSYPFTAGEIPYLFTYTSNLFMFNNMQWSNFGHSWSLSVEEQFYLVWPWLVVFVNDKYLKYVFLSFIVIGVGNSFFVSRIYDYAYDSPSTALTTSCFDAFGIGGLYAYFLTTKPDRRVANRMIAGLFIIALLFSFYWKLSPLLNLQAHMPWLYRTMSSLLSISIIHFTIHNQSDFLRRYLFEQNFLNLVGRVSYGIYLYHWPLGYYLNMFIAHITGKYPTLLFINNPYILFTLKFSTVLLVSYLSFELVEKHILKLKKLFEYKKQPWGKNN